MYKLLYDNSAMKKVVPRKIPQNLAKSPKDTFADQYK